MYNLAMDSFNENAIKRGLGEYNYQIFNIQMTFQYFPTQTQDEGEEQGLNSGESGNGPTVGNEESGNQGLWFRYKPEPLY